MNRRNLLKTLAALPLVGTAFKDAPPSEWPHIVGAEETPWLVGKINIFCSVFGERPYEQVIRCSVNEGWIEVYATDAAGNKIVNADRTGFVRKVIRGDVRIERKPA